MDIDWKKVWRVMHDLQYKKIDLSTATHLAREAGHPAPAKLAMDTLLKGYTLTREIRLN